MDTNKYTKNNLVKIIAPILWSITCFIFVVYYFAKDKSEVVILPIVSFLASLLFIYDIWTFYLPNSIGYVRVNKASNIIINFKLSICFILFSFSCISIALSFNLIFNDFIIWNFLNIIFSLIWSMITIKYQKYNEQNSNENDFKELNHIKYNDDSEMVEENLSNISGVSNLSKSSELNNSKTTVQFTSNKKMGTNEDILAHLTSLLQGKEASVGSLSPAAPQI